MRLISWLVGRSRPDTISASPLLAVCELFPFAIKETDFVLSQTVDKKSWILSDPQGDAMILWEHGQFAATWNLISSSHPGNRRERVALGMTIRRMAEWLAYYRPELLTC